MFTQSKLNFTIPFLPYASSIFSRNGLGRCTPYRGKVCAKYLSGEGRNTIFEYSYSPQNLVEKQLVREFSKFKESKQFSKR